VTGTPRDNTRHFVYIRPDIPGEILMHVQVHTALLHVAEQGNPSALPMVFIHGFPFSHKMWDAQVAALSPHYRTIAYDVRGLGESSMGDGQYTIEGHVDDLLAVMDHFGFAKAVIAGQSMGGYIILRALERNPERFLAAILCNTRTEADGNEAKIMRARTVAAVKTRGSGWFADDFIRKVFAASSFTRIPEAVEHIRTTIARTPPLAIAGTLLALASRTDTTAVLETITVPTLIIVGEHDVTTPPDASRAMHAKIPGSELHIIPHAAHMSPLENAEVVNRVMLAFLERVR
jgi:3-oxoadipate enol-lactonase